MTVPIGTAVTPEDPQRRELPAEIASVFEAERAYWEQTVQDYQGSDAVASHAATACDTLENVERGLLAALSDTALLGYLLTSQGYEPEVEYGSKGHQGRLFPRIRHGDQCTHYRTSWVSPWTPITEGNNT